jgi:hypothetical protein
MNNSLDNILSHSKNFLRDEQEEREQYLKIVVYFVFFVTGSLTVSHFAQKIHITPYVIGSYFLITSIALFEKYRKKFHTFWSWYIVMGAILTNCLALYFAGGINAPGLIWMIIIAVVCELIFTGKRKFIPFRSF